MPYILIAIPVLGRPHRAQPVVDSIEKSTDVPHRVLFLTSPGDRRQRHACEQTGADVWEVPWQAERGDYARKINAALKWDDESPWIFCGADDLDFKPGWSSAALALGWGLDLGVVGTNDAANPRVKAGRHSTHSLVARSYADGCGTIDEPGKILHEGYDHQYVDDELIATAKSRDCYAFAEQAVVEHLHPYFGTAAMDPTYQKALRSSVADRAIFHRRRKLWA